MTAYLRTQIHCQREQPRFVQYAIGNELVFEADDSAIQTLCPRNKIDGITIYGNGQVWLKDSLRTAAGEPVHFQLFVQENIIGHIRFRMEIISGISKQTIHDSGLMHNSHLISRMKTRVCCN